MGDCYSENHRYTGAAALRRVTAFLCLVFLSACGGGGGGGGESPQSMTPAAATFFDIQGTIGVPDGTAVDSDLNDPNADFGFNNDPATAQVLQNPVTVGGYANRPGSGPSGRSFDFGDVSDFYRVNMVAQQAIGLLVAEAPAADLDLYLWDAAGNRVLDSSMGTGGSEGLTVPGNGQYLVEVRAFAGASNYVLSIGQPQPLVGSAAPRLSDPFVPGELIMRYRQAAASTGASKHSGTLARPGMQHRAGAPGRELLMRLDGATSPAVARARREARAGGPDRYAALADERSRRKWETLIELKTLSVDPDVEFAAPNYMHRPFLSPNDRYYSVQWHYPLINLPGAWDSGTGDPNVTVAVIDTGILTGHPDLQGRILQGYDFISDPVNADDGNGIDSDPEDPGDGGGVTRSSFHGTHVAGTVAAASNNGSGVAGVAWNVRLMPLRVCGLSGCSVYDVLQAVRYAAGLENDSGQLPQRPADVINLSLGGPGFLQAAAELYQEVSDRGIVVVAAAGNEASAEPNYPAAYSSVLSVSATGIDNELASYSSFGSGIDLAAPGGDTGDLNGDGYPDFVLSTGGDDSAGQIQFAYTFLMGTSMASPHVAGVMALMKSANPALSASQIRQLLINGELTDDLGTAGRDDLYGHGLINARKAVIAALNAAGNPPAVNPLLEVQPAALNLGTTMTALSFNVINAGGGSLQVTGIESSEAWLSVVPVSTDGAGLGGYLATVNRSGLGEGTYAATITVRSDINDVELPVLMQVVSDPVTPDAGFLYILLIDPQTREVVREFPVSALGGAYDFEFLGVPAGDYELVAGTDADNDFVICDPGEACGQYLTIDQPLTITLDADRRDVDFTVGYVLSIAPQSVGSGRHALPR